MADAFSMFIPQAWAMAAIAVATLLLSAALLAQPWRLEGRRARLRAAPFPAAWRRILRRQVPLVARLPADLQQQLKRHIQVFVAEKPFIGCQGLVVTEAMRVVVAAQACLLLLGRARPDYFPQLRQVLLYPGAFVVDRLQPLAGGVQREQRRVLAGESWSQGQVILSWADVAAGAAAHDDGHNVVIHEFAHQLDQQQGAANGAPALPGGSRGLERRRRWSRVLGAEFERLQQQVAAGEPTLLDAYAATDAAEFFAVTSEVFFEQPRQLAAEHPALYRELAELYRIDPAQW
jgi:MtfA peptidase